MSFDHDAARIDVGAWQGGDAVALAASRPQSSSLSSRPVAARRGITTAILIAIVAPRRGIPMPRKPGTKARREELALA